MIRKAGRICNAGIVHKVGRIRNGGIIRKAGRVPPPPSGVPPDTPNPPSPGGQSTPSRTKEEGPEEGRLGPFRIAKEQGNIRKDQRQSVALCGELRQSDTLCEDLRLSDALCGGLERSNALCGDPSFSGEIIQTSDVIKTPGMNVSLSCTHTYNNFFYLFWYQRTKQDTSLKLTGYLYTTTFNKETDYEKRFHIYGDAKSNGILQISNLNSDDDAFKQPSDLIANPTDDVKISCKHDGNNLYVMLWYQRRKESTTLALISYNYDKATPSYETGYPDTRFKHNRIDTVTGDLTISNLNLSDSAVYYCAAREHNSCTGVLITQWPKYISSFTNTSVDMHCYQNDTDYDYTYWYRQTEGRELVLMLRFVAGISTPEKGFENGFRVWGTKKKWSLTVDVKEGIDAVYLCAARFHRRTNCANIQQSSSLIVNENQHVAIYCSHEDTNLDIMLWYQRKIDNKMALIGYSYNMNEPNNENDFKERFKQNRKSTKEGNLTISNVLQSDSAVYYCAARRASCSTIQQIPAGSLLAKEKDNITIQCSHDDNSLLLMLWYQQKSDSTNFSLISYIYGSGKPSNEDEFKDRFHMTKENTLKGNLTISKVLQSDSAVYYCAAIFSTGKANKVQVQQTPSLLANAASNVTIRCSHDNSGLPRMLWYQQKSITVLSLIGYTAGATSEPNNEEGFNKDRFKQSRKSMTEGSLTISDLLQTDSAVYYCAASEHSAAFLHSNRKTNGVTFQQTPSILVNEGENITISCSHNDNNLARMYWYQQNSHTVMALVGYTNTENSNPNYEKEFEDRFKLSRQALLAGSLAISNLRQSDSAVYYCAARNTSSVKIQQTPSLLVNEKEAVTIQCSHGDSSLLQMYWYQQSSHTDMALIGYTAGASSKPNYEASYNDRINISRQSTLAGSLTISNLNQSDSAVYYCAARETLAVQLLQERSSVMATAGSTMTFQCNIDARFSMSSYTMQWYKQAYHGAPVQFLMMEYELATKKMSIALVKAENKFSLHVSNLTLQDGGVYYCAASHSETRIGLSLTRTLT
ncbi:hypothetical protein C0J45_7944 [Silurus meridionalis]|nr:hypothetical protein C0J45_7944 [Silurus meridionalis]